MSDRKRKQTNPTFSNRRRSTASTTTTTVKVNYSDHEDDIFDFDASLQKEKLVNQRNHQYNNNINSKLMVALSPTIVTKRHNYNTNSNTLMGTSRLDNNNKNYDDEDNLDSPKHNNNKSERKQQQQEQQQQQQQQEKQKQATVTVLERSNSQLSFASSSSTSSSSSIWTVPFFEPTSSSLSQSSSKTSPNQEHNTSNDNINHTNKNNQNNNTCCSDETPVHDNNNNNSHDDDKTVTTKSSKGVFSATTSQQLLRSRNRRRRQRNEQDHHQQQDGMISLESSVEESSVSTTAKTTSLGDGSSSSSTKLQFLSFDSLVSSSTIATTKTSSSSSSPTKSRPSTTTITSNNSPQKYQSQSQLSSKQQRIEYTSSSQQSSTTCYLQSSSIQESSKSSIQHQLPTTMDDSSSVSKTTIELSDSISSSQSPPNSQSSSSSVQIIEQPEQERHVQQHQRKVRFATLAGASTLLSGKRPNPSSIQSISQHRQQESYPNRDAYTTTTAKQLKNRVLPIPIAGRPPLPPSAANVKHDTKYKSTEPWGGGRGSTDIQRNHKSLTNTKVPPDGGRNHFKRNHFGTLATSSNNNISSYSTTSDIFTIQDKGNYEMLVDECKYLCQNLTTITFQLSSMGGYIDYYSKLRTCYSTASELAYLLSSKKNRRTILLRQQKTNSIDENEREDPLHSILNVFGWIETFVLETKYESIPSVTEPQGDDDSNPLVLPRRNPRKLGNSNYNIAAYNTLRQQVLDTLGMCVYFISLDCTLSDDNMASVGYSGNTNAVAKSALRIRKAMLTHDTCIRGILHLILSDPFTMELRVGKSPNRLDSIYYEGVDQRSKNPPLSLQTTSPLRLTPGTDQDEASVSTTTTTTPMNAITTFDMSSPSFMVTDKNTNTPDSQQSCESGISVDPTQLGRLQRKRRRLELEQLKDVESQQFVDTSSDTVNENKQICGDNDMLSFTSDTPSFQQYRNGSKKLSISPTRMTSDDLSVASSTESYLNKLCDRLDHVKSRICECLDEGACNGSGKIKILRENDRISEVLTCDDLLADPINYTISSVVPLISLSRIINGKIEGSDVSCIDDDTGETNDDEYNPILETNKMLRDSGAIPLLSLALAETLNVVAYQLELARSMKFSKYRAALYNRVSALVQLIDGASLLSSTNRQLFCTEGFTEEVGGYLMISLLTVLSKQLRGHNEGNIVPSSLFDGVWDEINLTILKMLTSLSHENVTAAREMESPLMRCDCKEEFQSVSGKTIPKCGVSVVAEALQRAVKQTTEGQQNMNKPYDGRVLYDSIIFCLNILANYSESGGACSTLSNMTASVDQVCKSSMSTKTHFLTWLTRWLVDETQSFRDAVIESTFGTSPSKHHDRQLDAQEDEKLVIAGNGFVLLCCILVDDKDENENCDSSDPNSASVSATNQILRELPGSTCEAKMMYVKNTLKAFCNFYHFSIGDLSLAIVAPVKQLIRRLDTRFDNDFPMNVEETDIK